MTAARITERGKERREDKRSREERRSRGMGYRLDKRRGEERRGERKNRGNNNNKNTITINNFYATIYKKQKLHD